MKLLKPDLADDFTFQYVVRNIYALGLANIGLDPEPQLWLESVAPGGESRLHGDTGYTYLEVFGLDVEDADGLPTAATASPTGGARRPSTPSAAC
ncbi:MAG: hypothetical protein R3D98_17180 [Candidatus Krumholzibacteriia bacterium]